MNDTRMQVKIASLALIAMVGGTLVIVTTMDKQASSSQTIKVQHATLPQFSPEEMVRLSQGVIVGTVTEVRAEKIAAFDDPGQEEIVTNAKIHVQEWLQNPLKSDKTEIVVQVVGGTVGDETLLADESPKFAVDEKVIVFLNKRKPGEEFTVFGWSLGKYTLGKNGDIGADNEKERFKSVFKKDMNVDEFRSSLGDWQNEVR